MKHNTEGEKWFWNYEILLKHQLCNILREQSLKRISEGAWWEETRRH